MAKQRKPIPKTQKEIANSLVTPTDTSMGNPNLSQQNPKDRALQQSWRGDTVKPYTVGIQDIDEAVFYYLENVIKPTVYQNNESIPVPIMYGSPEKWKSYQKDGYLRDLKGSLMAPLIIFKRESIDKNRSLANKLDANNPNNYGIFQKSYNPSNAYDAFNVLNNKKPLKQLYAVVAPDYVTVTYSFVVFTYYVEQLNKIIEAMNYASDAYWGDPERYKFKARIDSFGFQTELNETSERAVRSTFTVTLNGYIIPDNIQKSSTAINKFNDKTKVILFTEVIDNNLNRYEIIVPQVGTTNTVDPSINTRVENVVVTSTVETKVIPPPPPVIVPTPPPVVVTPIIKAVTPPITKIIDSPSPSIPITYDLSYQAILSYAISQGYALPSTSQQVLQNKLITTLKAGGVWDELDLFYVFGTNGDSNYASLNWKNPSLYKVTPVNSPQFVTNTGFTGNGVNAYLNTNWNPTLGVKFTQNSSSHGVYTNTVGYGQGLTGNTGYHGGGSNPYNIINTWTDNQLDGFYINQAAANNQTADNAAFRAATRNNTTTVGYRNYNTSLFIDSISLPPTSDPIYIMARGVPTPQWFAGSNVEFKADFWGGFLTTAQVHLLYINLTTYFNSL